MYIAITVTGETFDSTVADWPQTAPGFVVIDQSSHHYRFVENNPTSTDIVDALLAVQTAILITGNVSETTAKALQSAGITIFLAAGMTLLEALNAYKSGRLEEVNETNPVQSLSQSVAAPPLDQTLQVTA